MFPQRSFRTPFLYRLAEGMTTFSMPIGFLLGGGQAGSFLFSIYLFHSFASFSFHMIPSKETYFADVSMIDLLSMERGYTNSHNILIYLFYMAVLFMESPRTELGLLIRVVWITILTTVKSVYCCCLWILSFLTFLQYSRYAVLKKEIFNTSLTCCLFYIYLGLISYIEATEYDLHYHMNWVEKFIRYCSYLMFCFYIAIHLIDNKRQLNCMLTFVTSLILTPLSLYQTWFQLRSHETLYTDDLQEDMILFYLAFCTMDMFIGFIYYPEYFKWLEGIIHHVVTLLFGSYFLWCNRNIIFCMGLIAETSSIFLNLHRFFPHYPIFKIMFHILFVMFRIVLPFFIMFYLRNLTMKPAIILFFSTGTVVNVYWFVKQQLWLTKKLKSENRK